MKKQFFRTMILLTCLVMATMAAGIGTAAAEEEATDFLGQPFPDFTVTDSDGNTFTLSEALKDHEAVLINFWATYCGPCLKEFPFLEKVREKYKDRVAFIALNPNDSDTMDVIQEYRMAYDVTLPMARDEGAELYYYTQANGIPATVVVDRFGNAVFFHNSAFTDADDVERVLETFLGDSYTETKVLDRIPRDTSTQAFPVSAARTIYPVGTDCRKIVFHVKDVKNTILGWIVPEDSEAVLIQIEVSAEDDVAMMVYEDTCTGNTTYIEDLLDPQAGAFIIEQPMPGPDDEKQYVQMLLCNGEEEELMENDVIGYLVKDEKEIETVVEFLKSALDAEEVTWEYADESAPAENTLQAYIVHVVDQDNNPVAEVAVNFCTDAACVPKESDETGTVMFTGDKAVYHVQIVDAPEGYSWDESYEMYTTEEYGEWVLRVRKD